MLKVGKRNRNRRFLNLGLILVILLVVLGIPILVVQYQAQKTGLSFSEVLKRRATPKQVQDSLSGIAHDSVARGGKIDFLEPVAIGLPYTEPPMISNLAVADLDGDKLPDVLVCDAKNNFVSWIQQYPKGTFTEKILVKDVIAPAHVQILDVDQDGDNDIMVAVLGLIFPSNDKIGTILILENDGKNNFIKHVVADKIARVSDVRAGDLDGDGDMDLAAAQFGYDDGETRWMENTGNWTFKSHVLQNLSGPINVEILDVDEDGDLDFISLVSQEWEEIYCFVNDGKGNFQQKLLWGSDNEDFGSSGIFIDDFNKDGKPDILYSNGDAFDYIPPRGKPWHGIQWLENKGGLNFEFHRICNFIGAYSARPVDVDYDGDLDLFTVSAFNLWDQAGAQSFIWLENKGDQHFIEHDIASNPTHIITLEMGDFDGDGEMDFVTGGMHAYPPFDRMARVLLWKNKGISKGE
jgi:hypothetical protein